MEDIVDRLLLAVAALTTNPLRGEVVARVHALVHQKCRSKYTGYDMLRCWINGMQKAYGKIRELGEEKGLEWLERATPEELYDPP